VLNPFTPFGDCSLIRMANLYANVARLGRTTDILACLDMITNMPAKLMNLANYGIRVGNAADIAALDCTDSLSAVTELAQPLFVLKNGRRSFSRERPKLHPPG
jgi:cytosine deaminase